MAETVRSGNKEILGTPTPNSSRSREDMIIDKTRTLSFPGEAILPMENFEHKGDRAAGSQNTVADMSGLSGKVLQESYRAGFSKSAEFTDKVSDR